MQRRNSLALCLFVLGSGLLAAQDSSQSFRKAPPGVEEALKARVMAFFDLQKDGKFRQAESFVCEDTKDHYYNMDKQRHKGSQFVNIFWEEGYKQAKAQVNLDIDLNTPTGPFATKFPMMSYWRVEQGNWCYYVPPRNREYYETPFGVMKRNRDTAEGAPPPALIPFDISKLKNAVQASQTELDMHAFRASTREVVLTNTLPGEVELAFKIPDLPGLTVDCDKQVLKTTEKATIRIAYDAALKRPLPPVTINVAVSPFGQVIPIRILFDNVNTRQ